MLSILFISRTILFSFISSCLAFSVIILLKYSVIASLSLLISLLINALYLFYVMPKIFNRISKTYAKNENEDTKKIEKDILEGLKNKTSKRSLDNLINDYTTVKKINSKVKYRKAVLMYPVVKDNALQSHVLLQ